MKSSLKEVLARQAEWPDVALKSSAFLTPNVWIKPLHILQPVSFVKALVDLGVRLKVAHDAINRLALGETIAAAIPGELAEIVATLEPYGVSITSYAQAQTPPPAASETP